MAEHREGLHSKATGESSSAAIRAAVLVHTDDARRRRSWYAFLQPLGLRVLLSGREAEAAKCLADARLVLVIAVQTPAMRETLRALRPTLPVLWLDATDATDASFMRMAAERLRSADSQHPDPGGAR